VPSVKALVVKAKHHLFIRSSLLRVAAEKNRSFTSVSDVLDWIIHFNFVTCTCTITIVRIPW
jgi:hypothetical protein